jgi:predicted PhzF superfamily epimerase YddE/YHI9
MCLPKENILGNQLAVILVAAGLSDTSLQDITREMHFSETVFIGSSGGKESLL